MYSYACTYTHDGPYAYYPFHICGAAVRLRTYATGPLPTLKVVRHAPHAHAHPGARARAYQQGRLRRHPPHPRHHPRAHARLSAGRSTYDVRYGTVRSGTIRYGTVRYGMVRSGTVRYGTIRYGMIRYITVYYGMLRYEGVTVRVGRVRSARCPGPCQRAPCAHARAFVRRIRI